MSPRPTSRLFGGTTAMSAAPLPPSSAKQRSYHLQQASRQAGPSYITLIQKGGSAQSGSGDLEMRSSVCRVRGAGSGMGSWEGVTFSGRVGSVGGLIGQVLDSCRTGLQGAPHVSTLSCHLLDQALLSVSRWIETVRLFCHNLL